MSRLLFHSGYPLVRLRLEQGPVNLDLARSIQDEGLLSALFITRDETQDSVHPGKQRVRALRHLGTGTAPAVIWSKNNQALPGERDISLDEARQLLPGHDLRLTKCGYACVAKD